MSIDKLSMGSLGLAAPRKGEHSADAVAVFKLTILGQCPPRRAGEGMIYTYPSFERRRSQKIKVMKFWIFKPLHPREKLGGYLVANFLSFFPQENQA